MVNIMVQWMLAGLLSVFHPFFVSVIEINHNAKDATVEVSVRVFTEDMEKTLQKYTTAKIDIANPSDKAFLEKQLSNYIMQKLQLKIDGKSVTMNYVGHEIQKESIWCYLEVPKITDMKKLELNCTFLYDFEKTQSNIFHVKSRNIEKSFKLDNPKSSTLFEF